MRNFIVHKIFSITLLININQGLYVEKPAITLYSHLDQVVELVDSNITDIETDKSIWLVEFYAHWCGHCKRYAPKWKRLAEDIKGWSPLVRVGAMNCAVQSCDRFQVSQFPTVKLLYPLWTGKPKLWKELVAHVDPDPFKAEIVQTIETAIQLGQMTQLDFKYKRNIPSSGQELERLFGSSDYAGFIIDHEGSKQTIQIILDVYSNEDILPVHLVPAFTEPTRRWKVKGIPALIILNKEGEIVSRLEGLYNNIIARQLFVSEINKYVAASKAGTVPVRSLSTTTKTTRPIKVIETSGTPRTTTKLDISTTDVIADAPPQEDIVYQGDLELAVQYAIIKEIGLKPIINNVQLRSLIQFLEVLINYLPNLREPTRKFLISLREWPQIMNFPGITNKQYKDKVAELEEFYKPFSRTPSDYMGCKGSTDTFRGYPCTLWTLFHTLTVHAADKDPAFTFGGVSTVASAVRGYVENFFSCRECAHHFQSHEASLGYLPLTGNDTVLWVWSLHNMANSMLAGDTTEDPMYPKIQWPGPEQCPDCRVVQTYQGIYEVVQEEFWKIPTVIEYIFQIYGQDRIKNNLKDQKYEDEADGSKLRDISSIFSTPGIKYYEMCSRVEDICNRT